MAHAHFEFGSLWSERADEVRHVSVRGTGQGRTVSLLEWSHIGPHRAYHGRPVRDFWPKQLELEVQTTTGKSVVTAVHEPFKEGLGEAFFSTFGVILLPVTDASEQHLLFVWSAGRGYGEDSVRFVRYRMP